jgi:hypothetical protein
MIWSKWSKNDLIKRLFPNDRLKAYIEFDLIIKRDTYKVIYSCLKSRKSEKKVTFKEKEKKSLF